MVAIFPQRGRGGTAGRRQTFCLLTAGKGWQKRLTECFRLISLLLSPYFGKAKDLPREVSVSKIVVSVIGLDCPGVVYAVSSTLSALECNIEEVSQTILKNQFAAIFVANKQESLDNGTIHTQLSKAIESRGMHLSVTIRDFEEGDTSGSAESEPFVVTVDGEDRFEIIAAFSKIFADQKVNIENLKALMPEEEKRALLVFEISLPMEIDRNALRRTLKDKARTLGLQLSMQHRDIFEALHRVQPV